MKYIAWVFFLVSLGLAMVGPVTMAEPPSIVQVYIIHVEVQGQGTVQVETPPSIGEDNFSSNSDTSIYYYDFNAQGINLQWTATPASGWEFDHWDLGPTGATTTSTDKTTTLSLVPGSVNPSDWTVKAIFVQSTSATYTVTVSASPSEGGTVTGGGNYQQGASVTVIATANDGYSFVNWTENETVVSTSESYTFNVTKDLTLVAHFTQSAPTPRYTVSVSANPTAGGTVSIQGAQGTSTTVDQGTSVTVVATPNTGCRFVNWTEGGAQVSPDPIYTFTPTKDTALTANFIDQGSVGQINDDVESGVVGWTASSLWHITTRKAHSPTHSWWFGNEHTGTYVMGNSPKSLQSRGGGVAPMATGTGRVQGNLTSSSISLTGYGRKLAVNFYYWREVEYYPDGSYDHTYVQIQFNDWGWQTIWSLDSRTPSARDWKNVNIPVDIPVGATQVQVRFVFDSVDGLNNDYAGWFVDDIKVGPPGTVIIVPTLPVGMVGEAYGPIQLIAQGGVEPYTWSWSPTIPGLSLDPRTGQISGTPTAAGNYSVTITVQDAARSTATTTCAITVQSPASSSALLTENFDNVSTWGMTGLWHVTPGLSCITCPSLVGNYAYFGRKDKCSYDTGAPVKGTLASPAIDIPAGVKNVAIGFDEFIYVESYSQAYDRTWVEISFDNATWKTIWYRDASYVSPECGHVQVTSAIPEGATQMWIRFRFDSIDSFYNDYPGWAIDNVTVAKSASAGTTAASMATPSSPAPRDQILVTVAPNPITDVHTATFTARGAGVEALKIQIFDLSGQLVFEKETSGNQLEWHTENSVGEYLANGVYIYRALVEIGGNWIATKVQKIVILR